MLNNQVAFGFRPYWPVLSPRRPADDYLDTYFSRRSSRAGLTRGWAPTVWYNDAGGWTFGVRVREDYFGRFELNEIWGSLSSGAGASGSRVDVNGRLRLANPVWLRAAGWSQRLGLALTEGRGEADLEVTRHFRHPVADSTRREVSLGVQWLSVTQPAYLDPRVFDDAGTLELRLAGKLSRPEPWPVGLEASAIAGHAYGNRGSGLGQSNYGRLEFALATRIPLGSSWGAGARIYAGATVSPDSIPRQRRLTLAGADAYRRFDSPFLRSRGALFTRTGLYYQFPGGAGVRGLDPRLTALSALGLSLELEYTIHHRPSSSFIGRAALAAFGDGALANGDIATGRRKLNRVGDAGIGIRLDQRVGRTAFQTRFELPLWVSRPALAQDTGPGQAVGLRWSFSFVPAF
jgi:hypothetical protein